MKKNLGSADRAIRAVSGIVLFVLILANVITGTLAVILGIIGALLLLTSAVSFCPAYVMLKVSTLKKSGQQ